ncbi:hypothetical protein B0H11DRAFT_1929522 [Mycena galericulata]|nr:hypothetical protein B0H11DRAFT_1929522 [Mycena galericulata]
MSGFYSNPKMQIKSPKLLLELINNIYFHPCFPIPRNYYTDHTEYDYGQEGYSSGVGGWSAPFKFKCIFFKHAPQCSVFGFDLEDRNCGAHHIGAPGSEVPGYLPPPYQHRAIVLRNIQMIEGQQHHENYLQQVENQITPQLDSSTGEFNEKWAEKISRCFDPREE